MAKITGLSDKHVDHLIAKFDVVMAKAAKQTFAMAAHNLTFGANQGVVMVAAMNDPYNAEYPEEGIPQFVSDTALSVIQIEWLSQVTNEILPFLGKVYLQGAMAIIVNVKENVPTAGKAELPEVSAEGAQLFLAAASNRVKSFSGRMWDVAKQELTDGVASGQSIEKIAQRVAAATSITQKKANVIAQTEVISAVNAGEFAQMRQMASAFDFVTEKEWVSTHDTHTRPSHSAANGQKVALNEKFNVGNAFLDFPGDPTGPANEIISCRCTTVYEVADSDEISQHQTSPGALSAAGLVDTKESFLALTYDEMLSDLCTLVAANFNPVEHPRGKDGRFIKKGFLPDGVFDALKISSPDELSSGGQLGVAQGLTALLPSQWAKLTDAQKSHLNDIAEQLIDNGVPGSYSASAHLDDLSEDDNSGFENSIFNPDNVPPSEPEPKVNEKISTSNNVNQPSFTKEVWDQYNPKVQALFKKTIINEAKATKDPDTLKAFKKIVGFEKQDFDAQNAKLNTSVTPPPPPPPPTVVQKATPIKITHALIHAKHGVGDVIAQTQNGMVRIKWNGKAYDVEVKHTDGHWLLAEKDIKKSGAYAFIAKNYANAQWVKPGKQDNENSATNLAATKPAPSLIPAPVAKDTSLPQLTVAEINTQYFKGLITGEEYDTLMAPYNDAPSKPVIIDLHNAPKDKIGPTVEIVNTSWITSPTLSKHGKEYAAIQQVLDMPKSDWNNLTDNQKIDIKYYVVEATLDDISDADEAHAKILQFQGDDTNNAVVTNGIIDSTISNKKDLTNWKKIGGQGGSNVGGLFEAPNGEKYYVKLPKTEDHVRNEVLAASLYKAAGIDIPEVTKGENSPLGSGDVVVSKIVDAKDASTMLISNPVFKAKVQQGFAVDAWLANWDTVGLSYDNIKNKDGKPVRIDAGGSLIYRAQGSKKPFSSTEVLELETLMDSSKNPQAAAVFGGMSNGQQRESAKMLLNVTNEKIAQLVKDAGYTGTNAAAMMKVLQDRRKIILEKYDLLKNDKSGAKDLGTSSAIDAVDISWLDTPNYSPVYKETQAVNFVLEQDVDHWNNLTSDQQLAITELIDDAVDDGIDGAESAQSSLLNFANVDPADASPLSTATTTPSVAPKKIAFTDVPYGTKFSFYAAFKAEKVSPAWSGAKIYASIQAAKAKHQSDPYISQMNDGELLQIVDQQLNNTGKNKSVSKTPYADKVIEWLKTPNGKKAAQKAKLNAPTTPIKTTPATTFTPSSVAAPVAAPSIPTGSKTPVPIPGAVDIANSILTGNGDITGHDEDEQLAIYKDFRAAGANGGYFNSSPNDLFKNVQKISEKYGIPAATVVKIVDVQGAKKHSGKNMDIHLTKLKTFLQDPKNLLSATHIVPIDVESKLLHNAPSASTIVNLAPQPSGTKSEILAKSSLDFTIRSTAWAASAFSSVNTKDPLKPNQKSALLSYTGSGYQSMNNALRKKSGVDSAMLKKLNDAQAGMRPISEDILVHRGTSFAQFGAIKNADEAQQLVGKTLQDKAFMSTSVGGSAAFGGQVLMEIEVPKGTGAMYVGTFSKFKTENELLLSAGLRYRVLSVTPNGYGGGITVRVRIIPPPDGSV